MGSYWKKRLLPWFRRQRLSVWVCLLLSLALHLSVLFSRLEWRFPERKVKRRPIRVKFIQRAPRLAKPLELARRPTVVQRQLTRRIAKTVPTMPRVMHTATVHGGTALASLARPGEIVDRSLQPERLDLGPDVAPGRVVAEKESSVRSLAEDLLTADDMDYGRYSSYITVNPKDKRDVRGFIKLALVKYKTNFRDYGGEPDWNTSPQMLANIAEYLNNHTGIKADYKYIVTLDSEELIRLKIPIIFMTGHAQFEVSDAECQNLGRYLREGGFIVIDDSRFLKGGPFDRAAREMLRRALGPDIVFEKIPNDHPIYHCYYDFDGPPAGDDVVSNWDRPSGNKTIYDYLEAVYIDGRMVCLFSNKSLNNAWNADPHWRIGGNTRQLQFAVNIIIYAMLQPGGFTQQAMMYQ